MPGSKFDAIERAQRLAGFLGIESVRKVARGRYLRVSTELNGVNIVLWHAQGSDWIGIEGTGSGAGSWREIVSRSEPELTAAGFTRHQKHESSHQTASTFRRGHPSPPDGSFDSGLKTTYVEAQKFLSKTLAKKTNLAISTHVSEESPKYISINILAIQHNELKNIADFLSMRITDLSIQIVDRYIQEFKRDHRNEMEELLRLEKRMSELKQQIRNDNKS